MTCIGGINSVHFEITSLAHFAENTLAAFNGGWFSVATLTLNPSKLRHFILII
jgi:hypothetical protein